MGRYGWKRIAAAVADNTAHLDPDREWKLAMQVGDDTTTTLSDVDRIRQLSEVVMFFRADQNECLRCVLIMYCGEDWIEHFIK